MGFEPHSFIVAYVAVFVKKFMVILEDLAFLGAIFKERDGLKSKKPRLS